MIIKFSPIALEKVWGGNKLARDYGIDNDQIGEIWGISAHKAYSNTVLEGEFKGLTLRELYYKRRDLFGDLSQEEFPFLMKLIDAKDNLSIQVHPEDAYALEHEQSLGKDECWYILDTYLPETKIVIGHYLESKEQLTESITSGSIERIVNKFVIKPQDYFFIPSGTLHAICAGTVLLEVSQSSNITYRVYDYNRLDHGKLRELHLEDAINVIKAPDYNVRTIHDSRIFSFSIQKHNDVTLTSHKHGHYLFILEGNAHISDTPVVKGDFVMIPANRNFAIDGYLLYALVTITA